MTEPAREASTASERVYALFVSAIGSMSRGEDRFVSLDPLRRVVYLAIRFRCEMDMGGIETLLYNGTPLTCTATTEALQVIGASRASDLVRRATLAWCRGNPLPEVYEDYANYWPLDDATRASLEEIAKAYDDIENLDELLDAYITRATSEGEKA